MQSFQGDLERLRRYWMTGTCRPDKEVQKRSDPLALEQFLSAFLMLMVGTLIAAFILMLECIYTNYLRRHVVRNDRATQCCAMVSTASQEFFMTGASKKTGVFIYFGIGWNIFCMITKNWYKNILQLIIYIRILN